MKKYAGILITMFLLGGCFEAGTIETPPEETDLVEPFTNPVTGYYSNLALEMEGIFSGVAELDLSDMSESERQSYIDSLRSTSWRARDVIDNHRKFCKKQLNTEKLHMNLSNSKLESWEVTRQGNTARIVYSTRNEILIMNEDLEEAGIDPDNFTSKEYAVKLPADHRGLKTRVGNACAEGYDSEEDLRDNNYFYYFNPDKAGCEIDILPATFTLNSLLPSKTTYPEYDRLTADNKLTVAVFFGAAGHEDEVPSSDWGVREHRDFVRDLRNRGFTFQEELDPKGKRYKRTRSGVLEIVDVVSPYDLNALNHDTDGIFKQALQTHEVIAYLGHSFYGSLHVLRDREAYPADTYQIIFMNSCWSYEYYTKVVFENKVTPRDPEGWELADVVNNTEVSWFSHNADEARILLTNLFKGCETGGSDSYRRYDWEGIIKAMNRYAVDHKPWGEDEHEIYGVSGVTTNCYDPREPNRCNCTDECTTLNATECVGNAVKTCGKHDVDHCTEWGDPVACKATETCQGGICQANCIDDAYEENDEPEYSVGVARGEVINLMSCPGDRDWFQLSLEAGDTLDVEVLFAHQRGDLDVQLYAEGNYGETIARSESRTDNERLSFQVESAGSYYLLVFGSRGGQNDYSMKVTVGSENCVDECTEDGQRRCEGDGYQVCGNHDADDCLEWGPVVSCNGQFCQNGQCVAECTDDYEPNNNQATAAEFNAGSVGGLRICPDDEDWYQVELEAGAYMQVEIDFEHAEGDLDMDLFDSNEGSLDSSTSTNNFEEINHQAVTAGSYFIRVYPYNYAQNTYSLNVTVDGGGGGDPCNDECTTHGDRRCEGDGYQVCGNFDADECLEWGEVNSCDEGLVCQDGQCVEGCTDLCTPAGERRCQDDGYQVCGNFDADSCLEWGEVNSCNGQECQDGQCVDDGGCSDDSYEDNDASADAATLTAGNHEDLQVCANDDDWYSVDLQAGDDLMVEISFSNAAGDLDLTLQDPSGTQLDTSTSTSDSEMVAHSATSAGTYLVRVYGYNGAVNAYSLTVDIEDSGNPTCTDDLYEENDGQTAATGLNLTVGPVSFPNLKICAGDEDWYALSLHAGETVVVDVGFTHTGGDLDAKLYDPDQQVVASGLSTNDNENLEHSVPADGTYLLQVYGFSNAENGYDLVVTTQ